MRIVFNLLTTLKPKTGVGQYAARLFAALADQLPPAESATASRPAGWPALFAASPAGSEWRSPAGHDAPAESCAMIRQRGLISAWPSDSGIALAFRAACRRGQFDLYHEPNFIPFRADRADGRHRA